MRTGGRKEQYTRTPGALGPPSPGEQDGAVLQRAAAHLPPALPDQLGFRALHARPGTRGARLGPSGRGHRHRTCRAISAATRPVGTSYGPRASAGRGPATAPSPPRWRSPRRAFPAGASGDPAPAAAPCTPRLRERPAPRRPGWGALKQPRPRPPLVRKDVHLWATGSGRG